MNLTIDGKKYATAKAAYRAFLTTEFWAATRASALRISGWRCCQCSATQHLQAHHWRYPSSWFDTTTDDLHVLCKKCHRAAHGIIAAPKPKKKKSGGGRRKRQRQIRDSRRARYGWTA